MSIQSARVEEKLFQNRYLVDAGKPHIVKMRVIPTFCAITPDRMFQFLQRARRNARVT